jgi:catechol 2,3-dioxygenase-like lactoylglutathione lyase family enzyme
MHITRCVLLSALAVVPIRPGTSAEPVALGLGRVEQIALTVTDIPRAEAFYERTLGLRKLFAQPNLLLFDLGGQRLLIGTAENRPTRSGEASGTTLYFRCVDLKLCVEQLEDRGVAFIGEPERAARQPAYDLWLAFFRDPDGNSLALLTEAPRGLDPLRGPPGD